MDDDLPDVLELPFSRLPLGMHHPELYRDLILRRGKEVYWERAGVCPCSSKGAKAGSITAGVVGGEPDRNCDECGGSGVLWEAARKSKMLVFDASMSPKRFEKFGEWAWAMAKFTALPEHSPGFLDRLTVTGRGRVLLRERRKREADVEALRYPISLRQIVGAAESNATEPEVTVQGTFQVRRAGLDGKVIAGTLYSGLDFDVVDGKVDWAKGITRGTAPVMGAIWSIAYNAFPRYVVTSMPRGYVEVAAQRRLQVEPTSAVEMNEMPVRVDARLEFAGPLPKAVSP